MRIQFNTSNPTPRSWRARLLGMFNLNDGRWGRDGDNGGAKQDPQGNAHNEPPSGGKRPSAGGPPDLDELWRDFNRKLGGLFGGKGSGGSEPPQNGGPQNPFGPDFKGAKVGLGVVAAVVVAIWASTGFSLCKKVNKRSSRNLAVTTRRWVRVLTGVCHIPSNAMNWCL